MDDIKVGIQVDVAVLKNTAAAQAVAIGELKEDNQALRHDWDIFLREKMPALNSKLDAIEGKLDTAIAIEQKVLAVENEVSSIKGLFWKVGSVLSGLAVGGPMTLHKLLELLGMASSSGH